MKHGYDVIVIGAGVIGTAVAYLLAREGVDVGLIERGNAASGGSGATMCILSLRNQMPGPTMDLAMASYSLYRKGSEALPIDFEFEIVSRLTLISHEVAMDWAARRVAAHRKAGVEVELVDARQLRELDNTVAEDRPGPVFCPPSARLNPFLPCHALALSAERLGTRFYRHTEVTDVCVERDSVTGVASRKTRIACGMVVDAAGPDADRVAGMACTHISIVGNRGVLAVTERIKEFGIRAKGKYAKGGLEDAYADELSTRNAAHLVFSQTQDADTLLRGWGEASMRVTRKVSRRLRGDIANLVSLSVR